MAKDILMERIAEFVEFSNQRMREHWERNKYTFAPPPVHQIQMGTDWCKVYRVEGVQQCIYAFIRMTDGQNRTLGTMKAGDIHKPASWKAPAKHARGNLLREGWREAVSTSGHIVYL